MDVKDFYPSVTHKMVYRVFVDDVGVGPDLARLLTRLTTRGGHLPQGAPTSDALANLVLAPVDFEAERIAAGLQLSVSRYLDNYDFAGARAREAIGPAIAALRHFGFQVRHRKTFNSGPRESRVVTGLGVNSASPSVTAVAREAARMDVVRLIVEHQRGANTFVLERRVRGKLVQISSTNPGFVIRMRRQLSAVGLVL